ncbi:type IV pilus assembly protein PilQ [Balnearium lithotrophicum]|uniref:Type IV pilus assembly protein PilQ n=1 Tax=Balnearium lithotrophicum TaxID=223788 RepID=A0A521CZ86_9BACT|nr:type IV pilus secretin PilQ [Balnearium lithotrophicum]SMO64743.1 type IV pilus assembly protein PilQ [Balnearium lithotrophicum]
MLRGLLILVLLFFSSAVYGGVIKNIDFLYSSEPFGGAQREFLEIDISKSGNCRVVPLSREGKTIEVDLENCSLLKPYRIGRRGNFIKSVRIIPTDGSSKLTVVLNKKGKLKFLRRKGKFILKIVESFITPKIEITRLVNGELMIISVPNLKGTNFKKEGNKLIIDLPNLKLKPTKKVVNSLSVSSLKTVLKGGSSSITVYLKPSVAAVEVSPEGGRISIKFRLKPQKSSNLTSIRGEGPKVSLHFTNADVRAVVRAIADIAKINVVFDPEVSGRVSVDFKNPVYWKDALKAVLEPLMLTYIETPEYYRILPKSKIVKQEKVEPLKNYMIKLKYVDAKNVEKNIKKLIKRGSISVNSQTNSLLLQVTESEFKEIESFIKNIDKPRKQVLVKAKIIQISSKAEKDLGFSWYISGFNFMGKRPSPYITGSYGFNTNTYSPIISPDSIGDYSKIPVSDSTLALGILNKSQNLRVELALKALEIDGNAQTISTPKVLALDNEEATIEQGVEIPYRESTVGAGGATSYNINFKKASLILKVKPHVIGSDKVLLDLEVRKDSPNYEYVAVTGGGEPAINTRNVKSKVLLGNGDTVVIGGIYEKEKQKSSSGVPGLSRVPLLGWLFKNSQTVVSKSEMLIFITPVIINSER